MAPPGSAATVYAFGAIALFVLLIACINFMNLATARSAQRGKEVGVRKAIGADRRQIIAQFLGESVLATTVAIVLAVALVEVLLPPFGTFVGADLELDYLGDPRVGFGLVALALAVSLVAGSYPAFFLSSFDPARVLKGDVTRGRAAGVLRHALVITQFSISIALLIATAVVYVQVKFANGIEPGYAKEGVVVLTGSQRAGVGAQWQALKQQLLAHPEITDVTASMATPAACRSPRRRAFAWKERASEACRWPQSTFGTSRRMGSTCSRGVRSRRSSARIVQSRQPPTTRTRPVRSS